MISRKLSIALLGCLMFGSVSAQSVPSVELTNVVGSGSSAVQCFDIVELGINLIPNDVFPDDLLISGVGSGGIATQVVDGVSTTIVGHSSSGSLLLPNGQRVEISGNQVAVVDESGAATLSDSGDLSGCEAVAGFIIGGGAGAAGLSGLQIGAGVVAAAVLINELTDDDDDEPTPPEPASPSF